MANRQFTASFALALATGLCLGQTFWLQADATRSAPKANRDFLPPVASINPKMDEQQADATDHDVETISLVGVNSPVLHASPKVTKITSSVDIQSDEIKSLHEIQQKVDETNLEHLWQATVQKNPVIRFALEKIATPADLQPKQSSRFLTKTLSTLISGATLASTMVPGGGAYRNMATMATGNALQNMIDGRTQPTANSLSPTEQIQLAGLIDDLKMQLIHTYQDYRNTLQQLAQSHQVTIRNNNLYSKALASKNDIVIMTAGTAYYQALMNETVLRQKAKLYRLQLERLAGPDAVSGVQLAVDLPETGAQTASIESPAPPPEPVIEPAASTQKAGTPSRNTSIKASDLPELPPALEIGPQLSSEPQSVDTLVGPLPPSGTDKSSRNKKSDKVRKNNESALIGPTLEPQEDIHR